MNIGIITHNFPLNLKDRGNAGIFVNDIAQELASKNNIFVLCPAERKRRKTVGKVKVANFPIFTSKKLGDLKLWNPADNLSVISYFVGGFLKLCGFFKKNKIDVSIAMWAFPSGLFSYFAKKFFKIPYITWCLGSDIYIYGRLPVIRSVVRCILRSSNYNFADGIDLAREVEKLSGKKCVFIPSASKSDFKKVKIKKDKELTTLAFVGRMEKVKGPDIFLEALNLIKKDLSRFKICFIGDGSLLKILKKKSQDWGINRHIVFYGNINSFQVISNIISSSDWLVIPSRSDSIPLVFSEAMKCGIPVISAELPDLKFLIEKYNVGLLFKKGDFRNLASIIIQLPKLEHDKEQFSQNTKVAAADFDVRKSAERVIFYLRRL